MTPDDLRQQIELQVVELIKRKLADGTMTEERSQQISQVVLDTIRPGMTLEELYRAVPKLDDTLPELAPIVLPYLRDYETNVTQRAHAEIQRLMKAGQYDAAAKLGKKAISQDVQLVWEGRSNRPMEPLKPPPRPNPFRPR